jgi:hypothetical protein
VHYKRSYRWAIERVHSAVVVVTVFVVTVFISTVIVIVVTPIVSLHVCGILADGFDSRAAGECSLVTCATTARRTMRWRCVLLTTGGMFCCVGVSCCRLARVSTSRSRPRTCSHTRRSSQVKPAAACSGRSAWCAASAPSSSRCPTSRVARAASTSAARRGRGTGRAARAVGTAASCLARTRRSSRASTRPCRDASSRRAGPLRGRRETDAPCLLTHVLCVVERHHHRRRGVEC